MAYRSHSRGGNARNRGQSLTQIRGTSSGPTPAWSDSNPESDKLDELLLKGGLDSSKVGSGIPSPPEDFLLKVCEAFSTKELRLCEACWSGVFCPCHGDTRNNTGSIYHLGEFKCLSKCTFPALRDDHRGPAIIKAVVKKFETARGERRSANSNTSATPRTLPGLSHSDSLGAIAAALLDDRNPRRGGGARHRAPF